MISPAAPARSSVVLVGVPPILSVEFVDVIVSPPAAGAAQVHTAGFAAVQDKNVLPPLGCATGKSIV